MSFHRDIFEKIGWYTQPAPSLEQQWALRAQLLAYAREIESVAADLQQIADELREAVQ